MPLRNLAQLQLSLDGDGPLHAQIYRALHDQIVSGVLAPGGRLPSTRTLAGDHGVSRTTTQTAYDQLIAEGYLQTRAGSGTFVAADLPAPPAPAVVSAEPRVVRPPRWSRYGQRLAAGGLGSPYENIRALRPVPYDFMYGIPEASSLPRDEWRRYVAARAQLSSAREIAYGPPAGIPSLRRAIAGYLQRVRGLSCDPAHIAIASGVQQCLQIVARLLCNPGDGVLLEEPCFPGARNALLAEDLTIVSGPVDSDGLDIDVVPDRELSTCRLAYVTPSHQFPTGAIMSYARRRAVLDWARTRDAYVFEDDYDSEFRYVGRPVESLRALDGDGRVIYAGTFSKSLFPALRIGYALLPEPLVAPFCAARWSSGFSNPTLEQRALADFMAEGRFDRHVRRARVLYGKRRAALLAALECHLGDRAVVAGTETGLHILVWLPALPSRALPPLIATARDRGVGIYPVDNCYRQPPAYPGLIMGYALVDETEIDEGIRILSTCL